MSGNTISVIVLLALVVIGLVAFFAELVDILLLVGLIVFLGVVVFFVNGWLFMLAVGNLGLEFGYWDSAFTAGLLGACFTGVGGSIKAASL